MNSSHGQIAATDQGRPKAVLTAPLETLATQAPWKMFMVLSTLFVSANVALLMAYRWVFVATLSSEAGSVGHWGRLHLSGLRMDLAVLGLEMAVLLLLGLLISTRFIFRIMAVLTFVHCIVAASNYFFFRERNLPLGEKLFAYLLSPVDLLVYGGGFLVSNLLVTLPLLVLTCAFFYASHRFSQRLPVGRLGCPRSWNGRVAVVVSFAILVALALDIYAEKRKRDHDGYKIRFINPRYYQKFADYTMNQAAGNPLFDLIRVYAPSYFRAVYKDSVNPAAALEFCVKETGVANASSETPLLRSIEGLPAYAPLRLSNLVIIQVEGLSQSMLARHSDGRPVMKFLSRLAEQGIYCPNIVQGFNATAGGVFTTVVGFPKGSFQERARRFTSYEMDARYASLPRILGRRDYEHLFAAGFRESYQEYVSFMSNQGFTPYGYSDITRRLKQHGKQEAADDLQGYFDGYFLEECAELISEVKKPHFVMHCVTLTSHSPWRLPAGFKSEFINPVDQVFDYVDRSIENFVGALKSKGKLDGTVIAVVADHTSVTFGKDFMERLRIPLIIYSEGMKEAGLAREIKEYGSQMDVVPSILSLLPGKHNYAGFGRSLLDTSNSDRTIYTGFALESWVFTKNWALSYNPDANESCLYRKTSDTLELADVSPGNPELTRDLRERLLSMYETSRRLAREQRVFPKDSLAAHN